MVLVLGGERERGEEGGKEGRWERGREGGRERDFTACVIIIVKKKNSSCHFSACGNTDFFAPSELNVQLCARASEP